MKKVTRITSICFTALLLVPLATSFFTNKNKVASEDKIAFPKLNENFFSNLSKYLEQQFYFRPEIIEANKTLDNILLKEQNALIQSQLSKIFGDDYLEPVIVNNAIYGRDDWLFYSGDNSVDFYCGTNLPTNDELELESNKLLRLKQACADKGINLVVLACPNKEQVYSEYMPSYVIKNEYKRLPRIRDYMVSKGINYIYPLQELLDAKQEGLVYYKQDTHWNARGAYIGYKEVMNSIGRTIDEPSFIELEKTGGDLSNMCGFQTTYEDAGATYSNNPDYNYIINADTAHTINESGSNKIYIVSDSFRTALQPYAFRDFNEVFSLHRSTMESKESIDFLNRMSSGDTLLIQFVERYESCVTSVSDNILSTWAK